MGEPNDMLTVSEFIRETIKEITLGLHDAQVETRSNGTQIFPDSYGDRPTKTNIDFDLAVTQVAKDGGFSVGVRGWGFNLGVKDGETNSEIVNHVHFSVEIGFVVYNPVNSKILKQDWSKMPIAGKS